MPRSVCVHPDHQPALVAALKRNGFATQGDLAAHLGVALSTVSNFFRGVKVSVSKFEQICEALGLDKRAMILPSGSSSVPMLDSLSKSDFFAYDDAWVGRESLVNDLTRQIAKSYRILLISGISGIGKTALGERLVAELEQGWHRHFYVRVNFDNQEQATDFAGVAAMVLEKCGQKVTPDERSDVEILLAHLVSVLQKQPVLLLVDSLENILTGNEEQGWSKFQDNNFVRFFHQILASESFASRLILTTQELPGQIQEIGSRYRTVWHNQLLSGLSADEQRALFEKTGFAMPPESAEQFYLLRIGQAYEGHPLALRIIAGEIGSAPFFGNVVAYWNKFGSEIEQVEQAIAAAQAGQVTGADDRWQLDRFTRTLRRNVRNRLEQTFQRLQQDARYAYILLCEGSVYRCAVPEDWWLSHLDYWNQNEAEKNAALDALRDRFLVEETVNDTHCLVRQHNLIRSISLDHLKRLDD
jgi:transcriptional regulator with XRE-family HTH domain